MYFDDRIKYFGLHPFGEFVCEWDGFILNQIADFSNITEFKHCFGMAVVYRVKY
jgi:hypothetical protein